MAPLDADTLANGWHGSRQTPSRSSTQCWEAGPCAGSTAASRRPAKHWEGRAAALAEVRRALRKAPPDEQSEVVARSHARWAGQLSGLGGEAWQHYTRGGLSALEELEHR